MLYLEDFVIRTCIRDFIVLEIVITKAVSDVVLGNDTRKTAYAWCQIVVSRHENEDTVT